MTHPIALLLSDIDGTLVSPDKVLTPAAIAAVHALHAAGIAFSVTSARPPHGMRMLIEPLGLTLPLAGFNGGLIVDTQFNVLESHPIDPQVAATVVQLVQASGLDLWVYTDQDWLVSNAAGEHVAREAMILATQPGTRAVTAADLAHAYKIVGVGDDAAKLAALQAQIIAQVGKSVSSTSSSVYFIDVTHPLANKGTVVRSMAARLGLDPAQIATIGDMANDVLMFVESGLSIAMGNATAEVQAKATHVTASCSDDGFAKAVERYILPEAPR